MTSVYSINYTDTNEPGFIINPGQKNGFGGSSANSSLILTGNGKTEWGQDANENFLHLLEHFASPARTMPIVLSMQSADGSGSVGTHTLTIFGDHHNTFVNNYQFSIISSTSGLNDGTYTVSSSSYVLATNTLTVIIQEAFPDDTAIYLGDVSFSTVEPDPTLVKPPYNEGQFWYNKSDFEIYVYKENTPNLFHWVKIRSNLIQPINPITGDLWYDIATNQLKTYDVSWNSVADLYLLKTGGTLTGDLLIDMFDATTSNKITFNTSHSDTTSIYKYENTTNESQLRLSLSNDLDSITDYVDIGTDTGAWNSVTKIYGNGNIDTEGLVSSNVTIASITDNKHLTTREYVGAEIFIEITAAPETASAWANFNGTGVIVLRDSFNVTSIDDLGSGKYHVNSSFSDTNYAVVCGGSQVATTGPQNAADTVSPFNFTMTGFDITTFTTETGKNDLEIVSFATFGGK